MFDPEYWRQLMPSVFTGLLLGLGIGVPMLIAVIVVAISAG